jgi:hypothetical protein
MHYAGMRTHSDIAKTAGDKRLQEETGASIHTVRSWMLRGRITPEHWAALAQAGIATLEELAAAAAANPRKAPTSGDQAAA